MMSLFQRQTKDEKASGEPDAAAEEASPPPPPPAGEPQEPTGPYSSSIEHLWDELQRLDQLVRGQTVRWRLTLGKYKPHDYWGMAHVTEDEVDAYLHSDFVRPDRLPSDLEKPLSGYWKAAASLAKAIQARKAETPPAMTLRLDQLQKLFRLSDLERDILLVCLLPELDGRYRRLFGYLQDDSSCIRPTVELALQILHPLVPEPQTGRAVFTPQAPLRALHLVELGSEIESDRPLPTRLLKIDDRIAGYLMGSDVVDGHLAGVLSLPGQLLLQARLSGDPEHKQQLRKLARWWARRRQGPEAGTVLFLHGAYGSGRLTAARAICRTTSTPLLVADVEKGLSSSEGWQRVVELVFREAALLDAAIYWAGVEALLGSDHPPQRWQHLLQATEKFPGLVFLASQTAWDPGGRFCQRPFLRLDFPMPGFPLRRLLWQRYLPDPKQFAAPPPDKAALSESLANAFQLTEGQIRDALATAMGQARQLNPKNPRLTLENILDGCRRQSGRRLMAFARRIEPRTELEFKDLILPPANALQLEELRTRIRLRSKVYSGMGFDRRLALGRGLIVLFAGSSGTGKTMAAELMAREQGVDLYKVDLSAVVSKYVGETEKNLRQVFAEAEDANAIIFFDEADALFGKRGEVKEARDRWANIEINYLLQRVEEYAGVVILASNLRQNIDDAFVRRLHAIVEFPFPETEARKKIWLGMFPPGLGRPPEAEIHSLAVQFSLSGGSVKNIVLDAAFRAMAEAEGKAPVITLRHLILSMAREYQKLGKPITKGDFGNEFYEWVDKGILSPPVTNPGS